MVNAFKRQSEDLQFHLDDVEQQRASLTQEVSKVKAARDKLKAELDDKSADIERLMKDVARYVRVHANAEKELEEAKQCMMESSRLWAEESSLLMGQVGTLEEALEQSMTAMAVSNRRSCDRSTTIKAVQDSMATTLTHGQSFRGLLRINSGIPSHVL